MSKDELYSGAKAYVLYLRKKRKKINPIESGEYIFDLIKNIVNLKYQRVKENTTENKYYNIGEEELALSLHSRNNLSKDLKLSEITNTPIDLYLLRESPETYPGVDEKGNSSPVELEKGKNFGFKTHIKFYFEKFEDYTIPIMIVESRSNTTSLKNILDYIKFYFEKEELSLNYGVITSDTDFKQKLREITDLKFARVKNIDFNINSEPNMKIGTMDRVKKRIKKYHSSEIKIVNFESSNYLQEMIDLAKEVKGIDTISDEDLKQFFKDNKVLLFGKTDTQNYSLINILQEKKDYSFKVKTINTETKEGHRTKEIDTNNFFLQLGTVINKDEILELNNLSINFYKQLLKIDNEM